MSLYWNETIYYNKTKQLKKKKKTFSFSCRAIPVQTKAFTFPGK